MNGTGLLETDPTDSHEEADEHFSHACERCLAHDFVESVVAVDDLLVTELGPHRAEKLFVFLLGAQTAWFQYEQCLAAVELVDKVGEVANEGQGLVRVLCAHRMEPRVGGVHRDTRFDCIRKGRNIRARLLLDNVEDGFHACPLQAALLLPVPAVQDGPGKVVQPLTFEDKV